MYLNLHLQIISVTGSLGSPAPKLLIAVTMMVALSTYISSDTCCARKTTEVLVVVKFNMASKYSIWYVTTPVNELLAVTVPTAYKLCTYALHTYVCTYVYTYTVILSSIDTIIN